MAADLKKAGLLVKVDARDTHKPGYKFAEWEQKGVPVRLALGPRDLASRNIELARRDTKTKEVVSMEGLADRLVALMDEIQQSLYDKALKYQKEKTYTVNNWEEFLDVIETKQGFAYAHWDGTGETEEKIKEATKATIRCIPLDSVLEEGVCVFSGKPSTQRVLFAKAY
jgi:prolyl-tRNA synthetase